MDPPKPLEGQEMREPNAASDELDIAEQGRVPGTGDSANEGQALRKRNVEKEQESANQRQEEQQCKQRVDRKRAAEQRVFNDVQARLVVYDERESLLAKKYRDVEKERKGREERERKDRREGNRPAQQPQPEAAAGPHPEDVLFKEVKNLVFIDRSPVLKKALEDWARKEALLTSRVERKSLRVEGLKNEVYQLIGFFSVFQGVVLTAVSQANLLHCNNKWSPILLSLLASVVTIAAITQKLYQISHLQETIHTEKQALEVCITSLATVFLKHVHRYTGRPGGRFPRVNFLACEPTLPLHQLS
jgi:hypothetical protein